MLRTVDLVADDDIPVLGVNLGQLGYLTEVEPGHLHDALARFLHWLELNADRTDELAAAEPPASG